VRRRPLPVAARRPRHEVDRPRPRRVTCAHPRERLLHSRHHLAFADHRDVRVGQDRARGRRRRARREHQRAGLGDRAEHAGDAEAVVALRRPRLDREPGNVPVEVGEVRPAHAKARALLGERVRQVEAVDVARDRVRDLVARRDTLERARHVVHAVREARDEILGHRRARALRVRRDVILRDLLARGLFACGVTCARGLIACGVTCACGLIACGVTCACGLIACGVTGARGVAGAHAECRAHATEDRAPRVGVRRDATAVRVVAHRLLAPRMNAAMRATPSSIAAFDVA